MKAIHNKPGSGKTTKKMFMPIIRYKNESNSQRLSRLALAIAGCLCQSLDTRMKAIHNHEAVDVGQRHDVYANH